MTLALVDIAAVVVDLLLLCIALPLVVAQVLLRSARSWSSAAYHRLSWPWADGSAARRTRRARQVDALEHALPPAHPALAASAMTIAADLRSGRWTSVEVCNAFIVQAKKVRRVVQRCEASPCTRRQTAAAVAVLLAQTPTASRPRPSLARHIILRR